MTTPFVHDLDDDVQRYVVEALATVRDVDPTRTLTLDELAERYDPPKPNNSAELRSICREDLAFTSNVSNFELHEWLIERGIDNVNTDNKNGDTVPIARLGDTGEDYRLADDVRISTLQMRGEPLFPPTLPDPFDPETGAWKENSRTFDPKKLGPLRESMKRLGWPKMLPAVVDENGVVIMGHRRLVVAEELGIEPVIEIRQMSTDEKIRLALASNTAAENTSPADRKEQAEYLYGSRNYSIEKIAELLKTSKSTVHRDLSDLIKKTKPAGRGGRPRKDKKAEAEREKADKAVVEKITAEASELARLAAEKKAEADARLMAARKQHLGLGAARHEHLTSQEPTEVKVKVVEAETPAAESTPKPEAVEGDVVDDDYYDDARDRLVEKWIDLREAVTDFAEAVDDPDLPPFFLLDPLDPLDPKFLANLHEAHGQLGESIEKLAKIIDHTTNA